MNTTEIEIKAIYLDILGNMLPTYGETSEERKDYLNFTVSFAVKVKI